MREGEEENSTIVITDNFDKRRRDGGQSESAMGRITLISHTTEVPVNEYLDKRRRDGETKRKCDGVNNTNNLHNRRS